MTPRLREALVAVCVAAPSLMVAGAGWLEAEAQQKAKLALADNYGEFIRDQMHEEEEAAAVERALDRCMARLADGRR